MIFKLAKDISEPLDKVIKSIDWSPLVRAEIARNALFYAEIATFKKLVTDNAKAQQINIPINWDVEEEWNMIYRDIAGKLQ